MAGVGEVKRGKTPAELSFALSVDLLGLVVAWGVGSD